MEILESCNMCLAFVVCKYEVDRGSNVCKNFHKLVEEKFNSASLRLCGWSIADVGENKYGRACGRSGGVQCCYKPMAAPYPSEKPTNEGSH